MPSLFVSHGSPMSALDQASAAEYRTSGQRLPRPRAILIFSAHWETDSLAFGELINHERLLYDFYGFPEALYQSQYPAPGAASLVDEIQNIFVDDIPIISRALDHGVWVPLLHMWPAADVPVLQMSLPSSYSNQQLFELGQCLMPLRQQSVMIIGAGTLSHNLREGMMGRYADTPDWVISFDRWLEHALLEDRQQLLDWENLAPEAKRNHPTAEHFRPLLITVGSATDAESVTFPMKGFEMAVFSKRSVQFS